MPANMSEERRAAMAAYGAELISVPAGKMELARDLAHELQVRQHIHLCDMHLPDAHALLDVSMHSRSLYWCLMLPALKLGMQTVPRGASFCCWRKIKDMARLPGSLLPNLVPVVVYWRC